MTVLQLVDARAREPLLTLSERAALHGAPWLAALPPQARQDLLQHGKVSTVRANERLSPGASGSPALCGLASGALSVRLAASDAEVVDYLAPGTWFADAGALAGGASPLVLRAHRRTTVVSLPAAVVHDLVRRHPCVLAPVLTLGSGLTTRLLGILDELATCCLKVRLARCLLRLCDAFGVAERGGVRVMLLVHQGELGSLLRASRQRLNLELKKLEAAGAVRIEKKELLVTDLRALQELACAERWPEQAAPAARV
jgi:CRP/FNR family cyclic AMP-dependent transcriptional regulator